METPVNGSRATEAAVATSPSSPGVGRGPALHRWYAALTLAYVSGLTWLSSIPRASTTQPHAIVEASLNLLHVPLFGGLAFCYVKAITGGSRWPALNGRTWSVVVATLSIFAALNEWQQEYVPGRSCSLSDFLLDVLGFAAMLLILQIETRFNRRRS